MRRIVVVLCVLAVIMTGCGGDDDVPAKPIRTLQPQQTASSPSPDPDTTKNSDGCKLLTKRDRRSIAGDPLDSVQPMPVIDGVLICRWVKTLSSPRTTSVKVTSQTVRRWAQTTMARRIDRLTASGRVSDKLTPRLQAAKKKILRGTEDISDAEACRMFSLLVEAYAKKKGRTEGLQYVGTTSGDFTVGWQKCGGGVHTELTYEEPGLHPSLALSQSVIRLGKVAHRRAIDKLG